MQRRSEASNLTTNSLSGLPLASAWFERALLALKTLATPVELDATLSSRARQTRGRSVPTLLH
jgi:hypothetical protein